MKHSVCLFVYVVFATACFGSTFANEDDGEIVDHCPLLTRRQSPLIIVQELMTIQARCLNETSHTDLKRLDKLTGLEEHRVFYKHLCSARAANRECLADEYTKWTSCYNETMANLFTIVDGLLDSSFEKGCADDGANLAVITEGYNRFTQDYRARNPFVRECIIYTYSRWVIVLRSKASIPTKIWFFYREFQNFKTCFSEHIPEDSLVTVSVQHMNEMLDEMKCIHPVDENLVLCKSIDSSLIDRTSVCPLSTNDESSPPISSLLERGLLRCFAFYEPYTRTLSNASSYEEFVSYFNNYCQRSDRARRCINETTTAAELCLHDAQFKNFKLERDFMTSALEAGCVEDGRRLAKVLYTAKRGNNADKQNDLIECLLAAARTLTSMPIENPSRLYQFYQELPVAGRCIADKTSGDSTYYDDVNGLIGDVMAKMKCVDNQSGSIVLCQTIGI